MKRYYYNHWLAKTLLCLSSCSTITLGFWVFTKLDKLSREEMNHESIHQVQRFEVMFLSLLFIALLDLIFNIGAVFYLLSLISYYIFYAVEWFAKLIYYMNSKKAYKAISFEREAYENDSNSFYIIDRYLFFWAKKICCK